MLDRLFETGAGTARAPIMNQTMVLGNHGILSSSFGCFLDKNYSEQKIKLRTKKIYIKIQTRQLDSWCHKRGVDHFAGGDMQWPEHHACCM